jgi:hypothetical protein
MEPERPTARSNPARGVALIATAVVLGLFVVRNGFDNTSSGGEGAPTTEVAGSSSEAPPGGEGPTTTPQPAVRQPAEVTVLVANASGVSGAAADLTATIIGAGYQTVPETNAPQSVAATQVLFAAGFDREAAALTTVINSPPDGVAPMPAAPPVELGGAQLLVLLGPDLAG